MRKYSNGGVLVENTAELPQIPSKIKNLYLDTETTSCNIKVNSLNPWFNCKILGIAFAFDDSSSYYVPMRHRLESDQNRNLPISAIEHYLKLMIHNCENWINHNIKYDMHVVTNSGNLALPASINYIDTLTLSKLVDSDRFNYDLGSLSRDVCFEDISDYENIFKPYTHTPGGKVKNKDYGLIPLDYIAPYACQDIISNRKLYIKLLNNLDSEEIWETEKKITKILYDVEQEGMLIDYSKAFIDNWRTIPVKLSKIQEEIKTITNKKLELHKNSDCFDLICESFRLPILEYTEHDEPSFGKDALKAYTVYPKTTDQQKHCIKLIEEYRELYKLQTSFINPYLNLFYDDGKLHCFYNQCVRTGRLSCSNPNMQQLSSEAKQYIIPEPGCYLIDFDLKQIEYRIIAHYIKNPSITKEYLTNPAADYHDTMAKLCGIDRKPAKNMNFAVSFGAGKDKTIFMLREALTTDSISNEISFNEYCQIKGEEIYNTYHRNVPELKPMLWKASNFLRRNGYVRNLFGRIRRLPRRFHYKAFNNVIQSSAADLMKVMTVNITSNLEPHEKLLALVHDSWLIQTTTPETTSAKIKNIIETTETRMQIPVYCSFEISNKNWQMKEVS